MRSFNKTKGLGYYRTLYQSLSLKDVNLSGNYKAEFIGPWWLRATSPLSLTLIGFKGWLGKRIDPHGISINVAKRQSKFVEFFPMQLNLQGSSRLDAKPIITLEYAENTQWPWPKAIDELRPLNENSFLGITIFDFFLIRHIAFPFLLIRVEKFAFSPVFEKH